ncbi:MAG TPA: SMC family ATPase, partial [Thermoflexia bacterium]|nr:SMC family ATPase [Thermoflexia bacterium]
KSQLDLARAGVEQEREALARLEKAIRRWEEEERAALARQAELEKAAQALEERLREASAVEEELARVRAAEAEARRRLGAAQQRLAACDALQQQKARHLERREELAHQRGLYEELRTAFGVQGVPAMIIEAAVPEIETEANRLLSRMTNGRMHVRLETQRETKAGELRETLDIRIMDELGERPYENYSGGEQFRVNFALRIALSRLLARRAGAQLQTLIVDEGFGTQDAQGRERLVEAIHAIQDEFACLLIITHIEELQDAFPARIHVTKTPEGSVVTVI